MDLENKASNKTQGKRTVGRAIGIGLLVATGVGMTGALGYNLYARGIINPEPLVNLYEKVMSNLPFGKGGYNTIERKYVSPAQVKSGDNTVKKEYVSPAPIKSGSSSEVDVVDELASNYEVLPNIQIKDILGKNVEEFSETTDPEDVVEEITKGVVREMTKETLKAGTEAVKELSDYISSPEAREEALEKTKETVKEVFGSPEVREAASELGKSIKGLFGN